MGVEFRRRNVPVPDQYSSLSQPQETQYPLTGRDRHCYTRPAQTWNCSRFIWGGIAKSVNQCALLQTDHRVRLRYQVPRLVKKLLQAQIIPRINSRRPVYANKAINQNVYVTNEQTQRCKTSKEKADILCQYSVQLVQDFARSQQNP